MSLRRMLEDPLVNQMMASHTECHALLNLMGGELVMIGASKAYRQRIGIILGSQLLAQRYGMGIYRALNNALHNQQGWSASVRVGEHWQLLMFQPNGNYGILTEQASNPHHPSVGGLPKPNTGSVSQPDQALAHKDLNNVVLHINDTGKVVQVGAALAQFLGQSTEQLAGVDSANLLYAQDVAQLKAMMDQLRQRADCIEGAFRLRNLANEVAYFDWTAVRIGRDYLFIGKSSKVHLEQALLKSEERINSILESMDDAFFALDMKGHLHYLNAKGAELLGKPMPNLIGRQIWERAPHLKKTPLFKVLNQAKGNMRPEGFQWQDPKTEAWFQVKAFPSQELISVFFTDISTIKRSENNMRHQATHDSLTGLPNRLALSQTLSELLGDKQIINFQLGLLFVDLDGFKAVNDTLGHDRGDDLLIAVAERLRQVVRASDIVARLSGDEFVITLPYIPDQDTAIAVGQKIIDSVSKKPFTLGDKKIYVGASIGVALYPRDATDVEGLLKNADIAMYQAKQAGKNTVRAFHREMGSDLQSRMDIGNTLRDALVHDRIEVHFQPRFLCNGTISSVEALARMRCPQGKLIAPAEFIPVAEETGLIIQLGEQVLRKACEWAVQTNGKLKQAIGVSVNVSGIQLMDGRFANTVDKVLRKTQLPASLLELELTETVLMQNQPVVLDTLRELHTLGVSLSIDDFGTGYSSLATLHRMPVQTIKLDKSFVNELPTKKDSVIISRTVLAMAKALGMSVVAEGVETEAQRSFLVETGVQEMQGYGLARPMNSQDAQQFVWAQKLSANGHSKILH